VGGLIQQVNASQWQGLHMDCHTETGAADLWGFPVKVLLAIAAGLSSLAAISLGDIHKGLGALQADWIIKGDDPPGQQRSARTIAAIECQPGCHDGVEIAV
jgi:hypothetical protein